MRGKRDNGGCLVNPNYINYVHNLNFAPKRHCGDGIQLLRSFTQSYSKTTPCFYDCHTFETPAFSLPYKLKDGEFICWGHFCSLECCKAFASEENNPRKDSSISLIALMGVKIYGNQTHIKPAPSKFVLNMFGGPLSIEEYRGDFSSNRFWVANKINCIRSAMVYDVYLNDEQVSLIEREDREDPRSNKRRVEFNLRLKREKQPAHQTKVSLLCMLGKTQTPSSQ